MRVLFTSFPGNTHFFNSVTLAWALRLAGHEVRVASEPELIDAITASGLPAVPVGSGESLKEKTMRAMRGRNLQSLGQWTMKANPDAIHLAEDRGERLTWESLAGLYREILVPAAKLMNDSMIDDLVAFSRWWKPDLIVWDAVSYAGSVAAMASGAAHARILYSHDTDARLRGNYVRMKAQQPPDAREDAMAEWLGEWAGKYGGEFSEEMLNGQFTIDQLPDSFRLDTGLRTLSMRYVPYNGPAVTPRWIWSDPPRPRVFMTFGLSSRDWTHGQVMSPGRLRETLGSLADLDIELVVTLPDDLREKLGTIPENTRVVEFVPLQAIIPSCSAMIHQGGPGSFNGALLYGVPQLLISMAPDALLKAGRLRDFGAGISIEPGHVTGARVREALLRLLGEPSFRSGAERIRQEILTQPSPHEVVAELEGLVAGHRRGLSPAAQG